MSPISRQQLREALCQMLSDPQTRRLIVQSVLESVAVRGGSPSTPAKDVSNEGKFGDNTGGGDYAFPAALGVDGALSISGNLPAGGLRQRVARSARLLLPALWLILISAAFAQLSTPEFRVDSYATGAKPFGVDIVGAAPWANPAGGLSIVVANSGEDSVSIFSVGGARVGLGLRTTVRGIPFPYGVAGCNYSDTGNTALISSPTDNSVSVVSVWDGKILGKVAVGPQPQGVACFPGTTPETIPGITVSPIYKGVVSNVGDDSLVIFDVASLRVEARVPGVPAAKGVHGIDANYIIKRAWVAGTSANVLTVVDLATYQVLARLPVPGPTSVRIFSVACSQGIVSFNGSSMEPSSSISVPTPVDFGFGLASTGTSLVYYGSGPPIKTFPGIASAAGVATGPGDRVGPFAVVTSPDSNQVFLIQRAPPLPATPKEFSGVVNGASFAPDAPLAPNTLASVFLTTGVVQNLLANSLPLPKALGGVSLRFGGSLAYDSANSRWTYSATGSVDAGLTYVGPSQINFQMPPGISPGDSVPAQLQLPNGKTLLTTLSFVSAAPGIFSILMNGQGQGAVLNQDNSHNGDPQRFLGVKPAARGSVIQIFATGAGDTTPALGAGEAAPAGGNPLVLTKVQPTVTIGGKNAKVQFSGMAPGFVGLWQINAEVPADVTPGGAMPLVITAGGVQSNTVTIAVQ